MEYIIIKKADGTRRIRVFGSASPVKLTKGDQKKVRLGENVVDLTIESVDPIDFQIGDNLTAFGEDYELNLMPTVKKTSENKFSYGLEFESVQYNASKVVFLDEDESGRSTSGTFTLRANLETIIGIVVNNLCRVYGAGSWVIGNMPTQTTDVRDFSYSDNNCLSVIQETCEEYGVEFEIKKGANCHILNFGKIGQIIPFTLHYGRGRGLYELTRKNVSSSNIITRLYAYGSSKNLPSDYRNFASKLRLAVNEGSYIEDTDAVAAFGLIEGSKTFDEVYPHRTGTVTGIVAGDILSFVDSTMNFDLNEKDSEGNTKYLIAGTSAKITFNTGGLAGYSFDVETYTHSSKTFKIQLYSDPRGFEFPSSTAATFQIQPGDEYVITDVYPRQEDLDAAEAELLVKATDYLNDNKAPRVQYEATISEDFLAKIAGSDDTIVNIFNPGDAIGIIDEDVNISRTGEESIRISGFTRSLISKTPYSYKLNIADTLDVSLIERIISDQKQIDTIIQINDLTDVSRMQRSWRTTQELLSMVFDQEGYFKDGNIKPNSIETQMLSVGAKAQQMILRNVVIEPNYEGSHAKVNVTGGTIVHYGLFDEPKTWNITSRLTTLSTTGAYYIYARCVKDGTAAEIVFLTEQSPVETDSHYFFVVGVLHSVDNNTRWISLTYGTSSVNGRFIKTGRITSADGSTWFDLDSGEIHGKITFGSDNQTLEDINQKADDANNYITNTLPGILTEIQAQLDGQIEQFFETYDPTLMNRPAMYWSPTEQEEHLGDLFYNTATGKVFRWVKENGVYKWQELQDSEVAQALALANDALALAMTKRRIFTVQPTPPYEVGDLWVQGATGDIMRCKTARATGSYSSSDWEKASNYTSDAALTTFINGLFDDTVSELTTQIDGKIESWYTTSDPSTSWTTATVRAKHVGDMWYNTSTKVLKRYTLSGSTYSWQTIEDATAIAAHEAASKAQDTADGKRTVFVAQPTTPYYVGDLWTDGVTLKRCITQRLTGSYVASDWGLATNYDNTKTVIDGGIVTSGTVQLAGSGGSILAGITGVGTASTSVRIWAGATFDSRASAPFRVLQSGEVFVRYRIELQDSSLNGLAGICGQGTDGTDTGIRFWAGSTYANRASAPFTVDKSGAVVMSKATIKNGCTIGDWSVSSGGIFNDSGEAYLIARKSFGNGCYCEARIGTSVFPGSSVLRGAAYFENSEQNTYMGNIAAYFLCKNAYYNHAIYIGAGFISGFALNQRQISSSMTLTHEMCHVTCYNMAAITITLPTPSSAQKGKVYYIRSMNSYGVTISSGSTAYIHKDGSVVKTVSAGGGRGDTVMLVNDGQYWCYNYMGR